MIYLFSFTYINVCNDIRTNTIIVFAVVLYYGFARLYLYPVSARRYISLSVP